MNSKRISENNKRVMVGAFLTILIPLLIGAIYILDANDGSIPENWYTEKYYKDLVLSNTFGFMSVAGFICTLFNVYMIIRLVMRRCRNYFLFALNLVNPVISVVLAVVSNNLERKFP